MFHWMQTRHRFGLEIASIRRQTLKLGACVEQALQKAVRSLLDQDALLAASVVRDDCRVGSMCSIIQNLSTKAIATHQPVAGDLRELLATMQIAAELDRIGDHARHLAEAVGVVTRNELLALFGNVDVMAGAAARMLRDAMSAYAEFDVTLAETVIDSDEALDESYWSAHRDLLALMQNHPSVVEQGTALLFVYRFIERLGDHTTELCQWIIFARTGRHIPVRAERYAE